MCYYGWDFIKSGNKQIVDKINDEVWRQLVGYIAFAEHDLAIEHLYSSAGIPESLLAHEWIEMPGCDLDQLTKESWTSILEDTD